MNIFEGIKEQRKEPVRMILGTDWWSDCDDCVAVRLLANAHKCGIIELAGIAMNGCVEDSAASMSAFLCDMGLDDIPLGIDIQGTDFKGVCRYQTVLASYPHKVMSNAECESGVHLYRRLLAESEKKTDILEIGFSQILEALLKSEADEISPMSGIELVRKRVGKLWIMAGKWDDNPGSEHNFANNRRSRTAGEYLCDYWPTPITFLGFEVGLTVISAGKIEDKNDLLRIALEANHHANGRCSWDPMLALLAVINDEEKAGYITVTGNAKVNPETGENYFTPDDGIHRYVVKSKPDRWYEECIDSLIYK